MEEQEGILFSVNKDLGKVVDYVHIPKDYNVRGGNYLTEQVRLALGGAYIPNEIIYWLETRKDCKEGIPSLLKEVINNNGLQKLPSLSLRSLAFAHEERGLPPYIIEAIKLLDTINNDPARKNLLRMYTQHHSDKMDNISDRTVTAIHTGKNVLLFDDSGRGIRCMERYLQHLADNYFSLKLKNIDSLGIYYFSTTNHTIVEDSRQCALMFTPVKPYRFCHPEVIPYSKKLMQGYSPFIECSLHPCKNDYNNFLHTFRLKEDEVMTTIAELDDIYRNGIDVSKQWDELVHYNSFREIYNQLAHFHVSYPEHSPLVEALQKTAKDTARRILQTKYHMEGYELPKSEKKQIIKITKLNCKNSHGTPKNR